MNKLIVHREFFVKSFEGKHTGGFRAIEEDSLHQVEYKTTQFNSAEEAIAEAERIFKICYPELSEQG